MKNNRDTRDNISPGVKCQYIPPPNSPKLNGNGKAQYTNEGSFWAPDKIFHLGLKPYPGFVFLYLCRRADKVGACYPSQNLIAKECSISLNTVSRSIRQLRSLGLIQVETFIKKGDKFKRNRYQILLKAEKRLHASQGCTYTPHRGTKDLKELKDLKENIIKEKANVDRNNFEYNNNGHKKNNLNITLRENENSKANTKTTTHTPEEKNNIPYKEILADLNDKAGTNFRYLTQAHRNKIKARWREGNTFEDFQRVHSNRVAYWKDDSKMGEYLRPATLYSNKFENYLNAPFPKGNGSFNHTPYKPRANKYEGNKASGKQTIETNTTPLEEKTDKQYMSEWRLMNDEKRWLHDLRSAAFVERGSSIRFNIHQETEKLNALRVLAFKKKWKNEREANVHKEANIQN